MTFILIDETVRDVSYLKKSIAFASKYIQGKYALFEPNKTVKNLYQRTNRATVEKYLLSLHHQIELFDSNDVQSYQDSSYDDFQFNEQYIGEIKHLQSHGDIVVVLCDPTRFKIDAKEIDGTFFINHYAEELNSNISNWISNRRYDLVKEHEILVPTSDTPLPNSQLCSNYKSVLDNMSRGKPDKKSDYIAVASEVARRNTYCPDPRAQAKNKGALRKIFSCNHGNTLYVSIDMENGALEANDKKGKHLGEYNYLGVQTGSPDKTGKHDIIV